MGSEHLLLIANSRILISPETISEVPCAKITSPLFVTYERAILTAAPEVQEISLPLSHDIAPLIHALDLQENKEEEMVFSELLYSPDEINSFSEYLHFQRVRDAITLQMAGDYCEGNADCGAYNPTAGYSVDLSQITDEIPSPLRVFYAIWEKASQIGSTFGFLLLVGYSFTAMKTFIDIVKYRLRGFFWADSFRMARRPPPVYVNPDQHLPLSESSFGSYNQAPVLTPLQPIQMPQSGPPLASSNSRGPNTVSFDARSNTVQFQANSANDRYVADPLITKRNNTST